MIYKALSVILFILAIQQSQSLKILLVSSPHTLTSLPLFIQYSIFLNRFNNTDFLPIPLQLKTPYFQLKDIQPIIKSQGIKIILDITQSKLYTIRLDYLQLKCLHLVAYRIEDQFKQGNTYQIMPTYRQEGEALQALFEYLEFDRISYINQHDERYYKPQEFIDQNKVKISTSINIPQTSYPEQVGYTCYDAYIQQKLMNEFPKSIRIYGSNKVLLQADFCWQAFILYFATQFRMTGVQFSWFSGLEASPIINQLISVLIQQAANVQLSILSDGMIALTPKGYIPLTYLHLTSYYVISYLTFIDQLNYNREFSFDDSILEIFEEFKDYYFLSNRVMKPYFSVYNMQKGNNVEVISIMNGQVIQLSQILFPGPSNIPPNKYVTIEISYNTNSNLPDDQNTNITRMNPPSHVPCIINHINQDTNFLAN